jgi:hypothetical protein
MLLKIVEQRRRLLGLERPTWAKAGPVDLMAPGFREEDARVLRETQQRNRAVGETLIVTGASAVGGHDSATCVTPARVALLTVITALAMTVSSNASGGRRVRHPRQPRAR